ncbi:hypothetical protein KC19_VG298300 [Ceratodon purpureus]|uniref:Uncharacterized protein n=1 Tax=Ceratodon purpureus TaxID=3225 RepID=A0A8T0HVK5_CERPU|nr:hypothetical protein KC19_VG298300 [Ceratodon purpureus]
MHVTLLPDVVICCAIVHNLLLDQSSVDVDRLLAMLQREGMVPKLDEHPRQERPAEDGPHPGEVCGEEKRTRLAAFLLQAAVAHSVLKGRCHYRAGGWVNHYSASAQHQEKSTIRKLEQRRDWEREVSLSISGGCPCFRRRSRRSGVVRRRHRRRIHWGCKAPDTRESSG